jgi:predicted nuclease of predicted toxin-antitoxin system
MRSFRVDSLFNYGKQGMMLLVSTGNISNTELEAIRVPAIPTVVTAFRSCNFIELTRSSLVLHQ